MGGEVRTPQLYASLPREPQSESNFDQLVVPEPGEVSSHTATEPAASPSGLTEDGRFRVYYIEGRTAHPLAVLVPNSLYPAISNAVAEATGSAVNFSFVDPPLASSLRYKRVRVCILPGDIATMATSMIENYPGFKPAGIQAVLRELNAHSVARMTYNSTESASGELVRVNELLIPFGALADWDRFVPAVNRGLASIYVAGRKAAGEKCTSDEVTVASQASLARIQRALAHQA